MHIEFTLNNRLGPEARYLTWISSPLRLRLMDATQGPADVTISLSAQRKPNGGDIRFSDTAGGAPKTKLQVELPTNGQSVTVFARGRFGSASVADRDVSIVAQNGNGQQLGTLPVMVRIRKNADKLTPQERDRFIAAMAKLNNRGTGRFSDFRAMHVSGLADDQAHGGPGFLPWHRAYLLDLERELQEIDPSVALPYWRFDQKSPNLFSADFIGVPDAIGAVQFSPANPLQFWSTDGTTGIARSARPGVDPAQQAVATVRKEADTMALGTDYARFRSMEVNPHGNAHTRYFGGYLNSTGTAPRDPLFFLLHCNVDRLWAKWQQNNSRFDHADPLAFQSAPPGGFLEGHNIGDSLWPWNRITQAPRPSTAPGGALANSPCVTAPGSSPLVRDMLDYKGAVRAPAAMGFSYDDVQ